MSRKNLPHRRKARQEKVLKSLDIRIAVCEGSLRQAHADPSSDMHKLIISAMPGKIVQYNAERDVLKKKLGLITECDSAGKDIALKYRE